AVAALVWSAHPDLTARAVLTRILATLDAHRSQPSTAYGYGVLDAYRATTADVPAGAPNPVFSAVAPFMSRGDALARRVPRPAPAATKPLPPVRDVDVGTVPSLTGRVWLGIAAGVAGLVLLAVLALVGLRARRVRSVPFTIGVEGISAW
ncbi:MAG TPA: hypothetical protein VKB75_03485, partial [Jatrophihabitans sp.]|nr:hypothetical protein [Jatrophihabitans sp.]